MDTKETICAIATSPGVGAIAVLRISGEESIEIIDKLAQFPNPAKALTKVAPNTLHYGTIVDGDTIIDDVVFSAFHGPRSFTGENSVEISCHGSTYIQQKILELLIRNGARLAKPGEFTMRAFLNGKMDLSQAEGVADVIASGTAASHELAINQMRGGFSNSLSEVREELLRLVSLIELELDFSEEDVEFADRTQLNSIVSTIDGIVGSLIASFSFGNAVKEGVPVAIIGNTNAGKSTLLNALLRDDKAIVSEIAGTTRDIIEDTFIIEGVQFRFIDTAGIRQTSDSIEQEGINRAIQRSLKARIVLLVIDIEESDSELQRIADTINESGIKKENIILLINKTDLVKQQSEAIKRIIAYFPNTPHDAISAKTKINIASVEQSMLEIVNADVPENQDVIVTNTRHYEALIKAKEAIDRIKEGIESQIPSDLISLDIRQVLHYLGEITGEITNDEVLGNIFKNFCIGK